MKRPAGILTFGLAALSLLPACGKKGPLQAPYVREPGTAEGFRAFQRGGAIVLEWTNPAKYMDGRPLRSMAADELWALEIPARAAREPLKPREFESRARPVRKITKEEFRPAFKPASAKAPDAVFAYPFDVKKAGTEFLALSVRVLDAAGRASKLAAPVVVRLLACPLPPEIRDVRSFKDRIEVDWEPPAANIGGSRPASVAGYMVYRGEDGGEPERLTASPVPGPSYEDRNFEFGRTYAYFVRACTAGTDPCIESGDSEVRTVVPRDIFPPAAPAGLVAVAGPGVVSLTWESVSDRNLVGYKIWRREAGGADFRLLVPEAVPGNTYTDASVEQGKTYVYAVSACRRNGTESGKTESGPVSLKGGRP